MVNAIILCQKNCSSCKILKTKGRTASNQSTKATKPFSSTKFLSKISLLLAINFCFSDTTSGSNDYGYQKPNLSEYLNQNYPAHLKHNHYKHQQYGAQPPYNDCPFYKDNSHNYDHYGKRFITYNQHQLYGNRPAYSNYIKNERLYQQIFNNGNGYDKNRDYNNDDNYSPQGYKKKYGKQMPSKSYESQPNYNEKYGALNGHLDNKYGIIKNNGYGNFNKEHHDKKHGNNNNYGEYYLESKEKNQIVIEDGYDKKGLKYEYIDPSDFIYYAKVSYEEKTLTQQPENISTTDLKNSVKKNRRESNNILTEKNVNLIEKMNPQENELQEEHINHLIEIKSEENNLLLPIPIKVFPSEDLDELGSGTELNNPNTDEDNRTKRINKEDPLSSETNAQTKSLI